RIEDLATMTAALGRAFTALTNQRPGPVFIEVPVDVLRAECPEMPPLSPPTVLTPMPPRTEDKKTLVELLAGWRKPLILAGGGVISSSASHLLVQLAERLG